MAEIALTLHMYFRLKLIEGDGNLVKGRIFIPRSTKVLKTCLKKRYKQTKFWLFLNNFVSVCQILKYVKHYDVTGNWLPAALKEK